MKLENLECQSRNSSFAQTQPRLELGQYEQTERKERSESLESVAPDVSAKATQNHLTKGQGGLMIWLSAC